MNSSGKYNKTLFISVLFIAFSTVFFFQNCGQMKSIKSKGILSSGYRGVNIISDINTFPIEFLTPTGLGYNADTKTVFWDALPDIQFEEQLLKVNYGVSIGGKQTFYTETQSWYTMSDSFFASLPAGTVSFEVTGCVTVDRGDNPTTFHCESSTSSFTKEVTQPPTNPMGKPAHINFDFPSRTLSWSSVSLAQYYQIALNDAFLDQVEDLSLVLPSHIQAGTYRLGVRACKLTVHETEKCGEYTTMQVTLEDPPVPFQVYAVIQYVNRFGNYRTTTVRPGSSPILIHNTEEMLSITVYASGGSGSYNCTYSDSTGGPFECAANNEYYWSDSPFESEIHIDATVRSGAESGTIGFTLKPAPPATE